jgi:hypothetical protein
VTDDRRAGDLEALHRLLAEYCSRMDRRDPKGWAALFTDDGQFFAFGRSFDGTEVLTKLAATAPGGVHLAGEPVIDLDGDTATARSNFFFVYGASREMRIGFYDDVLVRTGEGWRFRKRRCTFVTADGPSDQP